MSGWLRRNRWGLVALPVAAALALGSNAQRVTDYWWSTDLRQQVATTAQDEWQTYSEEFTDAFGTTPRTVRLRVGSPTDVDPGDLADEGEDAPELPEGVRAVAVPLELTATPDQVLVGCRLALVDGAGNRYEYLPAIGGIRLALQPCLTDEQPGPYPSIVTGEPRRVDEGQERPEAWSARPVVLVPDGVEITQVLVWWQPPRYVRVELAQPRAASGRPPMRAGR